MFTFRTFCGPRNQPHFLKMNTRGLCTLRAGYGPHSAGDMNPPQDREKPEGGLRRGMRGVCAHLLPTTAPAPHHPTCSPPPHLLPTTTPPALHAAPGDSCPPTALRAPAFPQLPESLRVRAQNAPEQPPGRWRGGRRGLARGSGRGGRLGGLHSPRRLREPRTTRSPAAPAPHQQLPQNHQVNGASPWQPGTRHPGEGGGAAAGRLCAGATLRPRGSRGATLGARRSPPPTPAGDTRQTTAITAPSGAPRLALALPRRPWCSAGWAWTRDHQPGAAGGGARGPGRLRSGGSGVRGRGSGAACPAMD